MEITYLVGYENQNTYRVWIPARDKVIATRDLIFDETKFYEPSDKQQHSQDKEVEIVSFNEEQIESSMRIISEEEEQWLMKLLRSKLMETGTENEETNLAEKQLLERNATSLNQ